MPHEPLPGVPHVGAYRYPEVERDRRCEHPTPVTAPPATVTPVAFPVYPVALYVQRIPE